MKKECVNAKIRSTAGCPVILEHMDSPIITVRAVVNAGSAVEEKYGTAHFVEHLFFKGSEFRSYQEIDRAVAKIGNTNAYTSESKTVFYINTTRDHLEEALGLLGEMLFCPVYLEEEFTKEKRVILEELQMREDDSACYFYSKVGPKLFGDIGHPIVGTARSLESITLQDIKEFREKNYVEGNIAFIVVGDLTAISEADIRISLGSYLGNRSIKSGVAELLSPIISPLNTIEKDNGAYSANSYDFEHVSDQAWFTLWTPGYDLKQSVNHYHADLIAKNLIGGGSHSLLFQKLRSELGLCYSVGTFSWNIWGNSNCVTSVQLDAENIEKAEKEIREIYTAVARGDFSDDLLETAKSNFLFNLAEAVQTPEGFARGLDEYFEDSYIAPGEDVSYKASRNRILQCPDLRKEVMTFAQTLIGESRVFTMNRFKKENADV